MESNRLKAGCDREALRREQGTPNSGDPYVVGRRRVVAAAAAAGLLTALSPSALAAPTRASGVVTLVFSPLMEPFSQTVTSILEAGLRPFLAKHRNLRVRVNNTRLLPPGIIGGMLAGDAPDVFHVWDPTELIQGGYLYNIAPLVRTDGLDLTRFNGTQLQLFQDATGALYGLPVTLSTYGVAVNIGMLNDLGIRLPDGAWTWKDMQAIAVAAASKSKGIYGIDSFFDLFQMQFLYRGFGGSIVVPNDQEKCGLDQAGSLACSRWIAEMIDRGAATTQGYFFGNSKSAMNFLGTEGLLGEVAQWRSLNWRMYAMPSWPGGSATYATSDAYAIPRSAKHVEAAFELLRFVAYDTSWARWLMKVWGLPPALKNLYADWLATVYAVAPPARHDGFGAFADLMTSAHAYTQVPFRYDSVSAYALFVPYVNKVHGHTMSVTEASSQLTRQVNRFEQVSGSTSAAAVTALHRVEALIASADGNPRTATFPAPPVEGAGGAAAQVAPGAVTVRHGTYTLLGSGGGLQQGEDGMTFACLPWRHALGTFSCRVTGIFGVGNATLANAAKCGLAARAALSGGAAEATVSLAVGSNQGKAPHAASRPVPGQDITDQYRSTPNLATLTDIVQSPHAAGGNYLRRPVWLRLVQAVDRWTAFTSADGAAWNQVGEPMGIQGAGVWVGLFATPHDGTGKTRMRVVFDHVSFTPQRDVQVV